MKDLIDVTSVVHYENFRARKLSNVMSSKLTGKSPMAQMDEEKREHKLKMKKMEKEMETVFETKVREKKNKLKESEDDLTQKHKQVLWPDSEVTLTFISAKTSIWTGSGGVRAASTWIRSRKSRMGKTASIGK